MAIIDGKTQQGEDKPVIRLQADGYWYAWDEYKKAFVIGQGDSRYGGGSLAAQEAFKTT